MSSLLVLRNNCLYRPGNVIAVSPFWICSLSTRLNDRRSICFRTCDSDEVD